MYSEPDNIKIDEKLFNDIVIPKLKDIEKDLCDKPITIEEISKALKELPNNKTPGSDGLTTEFYKFFWAKIKTTVHKGIIYAFNNSGLSIEQKRGILSIIPKKDKDTRYLNNWRPLTLLNTDYKILTKLLAMRLQKVLPSLISPDQTGYLKGRYIGENIRTIYDVIDYTKINNIPGMMVLIDFEKAFDSISWPFLFKTLEAFNFGEFFRKWINIIYSKPECCITNNGFASSFFTITRGIRQGCPISALLFILVVEIMSLHIKQNQNIVGIPVGDHCIKVSQLADDTTLFLRDTNSLNEALTFLEYFKLSSGLKINKGKTEVMWLGSMVENEKKPLGLKLSKTSVRCLGILCNTDTERATFENLSLKIKNLKKLLGMWCQRNLSLKGRITFLKTMALPLVLYPVSVLHVPEWAITEIDKLLFSFVWCNKKPLVKKEVLISEIEKGGLKLPHFESIVNGIKCTWIKRILNANPCKIQMLKTFIHYRNYDVTQIIKCKLDAKYVNFQSKFYKGILEKWFEVYSKVPNDCILEQNIWDNKFVLIGDKPAHIQKFIDNRILNVKDIVDDDCKLLARLALEEKFNCSIKQMDYNSIIHALPKHWKKIEQKHNSVLKDDIYVVLGENKHVKLIEMACKQFTNIFLSNHTAIPAAETKWQKYLDIEDIDWNQCYLILYIVTRDTNVQSLQYRILNRIYPCNYWLSKWNKDKDAKCKYCDDIDYLEHYFYTCNTLTLLWKGINQWWLNNFGCTFNLTPKDIIFGICNAYDDFIIEIINYCILNAKYYIVECRKNDKETNLYEFLRFIKQKLEIEMLYYKLKNTKEKEMTKWNMLYDSL